MAEVIRSSLETSLENSKYHPQKLWDVIREIKTLETNAYLLDGDEDLKILLLKVHTRALGI